MTPATSQIVLGTASLGLEGGDAGAMTLLDRFVALGGRIVDTAAIYSDWVPGEIGRSERIIGQWLRDRRNRDELFIITKGAHPPLGNVRQGRLDRAAIEADVEASLRRLGIGRIDLYYLHRDDPARPVEDIMTSLAALIAAGKIAAAGVSNWTVERIAAARATHIAPISSSQVQGNVLANFLSPPEDPTIVRLDNQALADARHAGMSLLLYSAQCEGYFARRADGRPLPSAYRNPDCAAVADRLLAIAQRLGADPTTLAVRFLLSYAPYVFPVIGPRTVAQLEQSMLANAARLDAAVTAEIAAVAGYA